MVRVYSAASGDVLHTFTSGQESSEFGYALSVQSNAEGDQDRGLIVGAPSYGAGGAVFVFNLATGAERFRIDGELADGRFGHAVAVADAGDLVTDGDTPAHDGFNEFVVGAPIGADGRIFAVSGGSGEQLATLKVVDNFGSAIVRRSWGGAAESAFYIGAPGGMNGANGWVYSIGLGVQGSFVYFNNIYNYNISGAQKSFGSTIVSLGDLNGRGGIEIAVGAPSEDPAESAFYVMGQFSSPTPVFQGGPGRLGSIGIGGIGDTNADGFADVLNARESGATGYSSTAYFPLPAPNAISRDGTFMVYDGGGSARNYVIRDGVLTMLDELPGVGDDFEVIAVSDDGVIAGYIVSQLTRTRLQPALVINGERITLAGAATTIEGPAPDFSPSKIFFKRVGPTGDILFEERTDFSRAWVLSGGTLTFLWNGWVDDQATDGTVLGTEQPRYDVDGVTHLWTRAGGTTTIERFFNAGRINDNREFLGTDHNGDLAVFRNGQVTRLGVPSDFVPQASTGSWTIYGMDSRGRGLFRVVWTDDSQPYMASAGHTTFLVEEDNQVFRLSSLIVDGTPPTDLLSGAKLSTSEGGKMSTPRTYEKLTILNSGDIFVGGTFLNLLQPPQGPSLDANGVRSVSAGGSGTRAITVNDDGIP